MCLVLFFYFPFLLQAHTQELQRPLCLRSQSPKPTQSERRFHLSRPTVFLLDDTAGTSKQIAAPGCIRYLEDSDIYGSCCFLPVLH